jgi:hypothetical protein
MTFKASQPAPKPGSRLRGSASRSGAARREKQAIAKAVAKAERIRERQREKAAEKRARDAAVREALQARNLPTGSPVKPKREGPPRKGQEPDLTYRAFVRAQGCVLVGRWCHDDTQIPAFQDSYHVCWGPIEFHHVKTRGAGGKDRGNGVGLCTTGHRTFHDLGRATFDARYAIDLAHVARDLAAAYLRGAP